MKATQVVIEVTGDDETGSFTLHRVPANARANDSGPAVRHFSGRTVLLVRRGRLRYVTGTEVLKGTNGTLTLAWGGMQIFADGRWGRVSGQWSIDHATGAYESVKARGRFVSSPTHSPVALLQRFTCIGRFPGVPVAPSPDQPDPGTA